MDTRQRTLLASVGIGVIFLLVQLGALALVEPFQQQGHQVTEDGGDASLSLLYIGAILVVTAIMLAVFKYGGASPVRLVIIFAGAYIAWFVFEAFLPPVLTVDVAGGSFAILPLAAAVGLGAALYAYPEWYVIDAAGILMGIGAAALFGVNLGIFPVLVLLVGLAIYDAISVYRTKHMLTLASGMMKMRVPVVLVVPLSLSYSFIDADPPDPMADEDDEEKESVAETESNALTAEELAELSPEAISELEEAALAAVDSELFEQLTEKQQKAVREKLSSRDAMFIGLGDAIIPTILVASAAFFIDAPTVSLLGLSANVPALTAMVGTMAGLAALLWLVSKGRAHAGLPLLNGGAIGGYLIGALVSGLTLIEALGVAGFF